MRTLDVYKPKSLKHRLLLKIDIWLFSFQGYVLDLERGIEWPFNERPLFSKEGLIKDDLSVIPFGDRELKKIVDEFGGWKKITASSYNPSEALYERLESIGYTRADFDRSRRYLANPSAYMKTALDKRFPPRS